MEKMIGKIKWYKESKGYGYIIGSDDETYFFEVLNCVNHNESFNEGDEVVFIPNFKEMDYATEVEKVGALNEKK